MSLTPGARLAHYEVLGPLGAGGMGEVYKARDLKLGREVALKLLPAGVASDPRRVLRLEREARALAALQHPHVATLFAFEEHAGIRFLAMELVPGETLAERLDRGPMPTLETLSLFGQIADALAAAHAKGIVHRDLKPANIKITPDGKAKVLDFGLAKAMEPDSSPVATEIPTLSEVTMPGAIMGTAAYMSPEQARGHPVDPRVDAWAFGVTLYEALTGHRAFRGDTTSDVLAQILEREPDWNALPRDLPDPLRLLLQQCLKKNRNERLASLADAGLWIEQALASVRGPSAAAAVQIGGAPTARARSRWPLVLAAGVLIAGAAAAFAILHQRRLPAIDSVAVLPFVNASGSADLDYLADGVSEELINRLAQVPALKVIARPTAFSYRGRDVQPQAVGVALKVRAVVTGRLVRHGDDVAVQVDVVDARDGSELWGGRFERRSDQLPSLQPDIVSRVTETLQIRLGAAESRRLTRADTSDSEAYRAYLRGRIKLSEAENPDGYRECIAFFRESVRRDPSFARGWAGLADAHAYLATMEQEAPALTVPPAREAAHRALELDPELAESRTSLGLLKLMFDWDYPGAEAEFRRAIAYSPGDSFGRHWLAHLLQVVGRYSEALVALRQAIEMDPLSPMYQTDLAMQYYLMREPSRVLELAAQLEKGAAAQPQIQFWLAVALAQEQLGQLDSARTSLRKVKGGCADCVLGGFQGYLFGRLGLREEAQRIQDGLQSHARTRYVTGVALAAVATGLGERETALGALEHAYDQRSSTLPFWIRNPIFDSLRAEPRYVALIRRVGLPEPEALASSR